MKKESQSYHIGRNEQLRALNLHSNYLSWVGKFMCCFWLFLLVTGCCCCGEFRLFLVIDQKTLEHLLFYTLLGLFTRGKWQMFNLIQSRIKHVGDCTHKSNHPISKTPNPRWHFLTVSVTILVKNKTWKFFGV